MGGQNIGNGASQTLTYDSKMDAYGESMEAVATTNAASAAAQWGLKEALSLALAVMQYRSYDRAIDKQDEIAQRIQSRADGLHNIWKESYLTCELNTIAEICAEPKAIAQTTLASIKAQAEISKQFSLAKQQAMYCIDSQCEGSRCDTDRKFATAQAKAAAWQANANINQEIARAKLENAQRLNNRLIALNAGRQHIANTNSALAQASQIYQQQSAAAAAGFNGALATLGRLTQDTANANRTPMPNNMQRAQPVQASQPSPVAGNGGTGMFNPNFTSAVPSSGDFNFNYGGDNYDSFVGEQSPFVGPMPQNEIYSDYSNEGRNNPAPRVTIADSLGGDDGEVIGYYGGRQSMSQ
jgi:hypothetical protein